MSPIPSTRPIRLAVIPAATNQPDIPVVTQQSSQLVLIISFSIVGASLVILITCLLIKNRQNKRAQEVIEANDARNWKQFDPEFAPLTSVREEEDEAPSFISSTSTIPSTFITPLPEIYRSRFKIPDDGRSSFSAPRRLAPRKPPQRSNTLPSSPRDTALRTPLSPTHPRQTRRSQSVPMVLLTKQLQPIHADLPDHPTCPTQAALRSHPVQPDMVGLASLMRSSPMQPDMIDLVPAPLRLSKASRRSLPPRKLSSANLENMTPQERAGRLQLWLDNAARNPEAKSEATDDSGMDILFRGEDEVEDVDGRV